MGRIKQIYLKRVAERLIREYGDELGTDFKENKEKVSKYADIASKPCRNKIAGCVTRMVKAKKSRVE
ncbi:MAG: 30S ribosomal protein S17e [Candidatus Altiarchaeales archaeon]|nr:30S ribosomal protein S17e [Candidatus Altiarchaeales archaeon]